MCVDYPAFLFVKKRYNIDLSSLELADFNSISTSSILELENEIVELEESGELNAKRQYSFHSKRLGSVKAICLHVCHDCNMRCDYCFADGGSYHCERDRMSMSVGKAAIDFLIKNSKTKHLEVDFFGGEPLLSLNTVKEIVEYGKEKAKLSNKEILFTLTTNCVLMNLEAINYLNCEMSNVVLSIDGRKAVHDGVRRLLNGNESYEIAIKNAKAFKDIRGDKSYYVRGTFTSQNLDFADDILELERQGFDKISIEPVVLPSDHKLAIKEEHLSDICAEYERFSEIYIDRVNNKKHLTFFHFELDLRHGPCIEKRLTGCGAGTEYFAIAPNGEVYPCHQFVGKREYLMGTVFDGVLEKSIMERFSVINVLTKDHCKGCVAKYHCGGGCIANALNATGDLNGQFKIGCEMLKKRFEIALALAYLKKDKK